jgi:hypothetical protein
MARAKSAKLAKENLIFPTSTLSSLASFAPLARDPKSKRIKETKVKGCVSADSVTQKLHIID